MRVDHARATTHTDMLPVVQGTRAELTASRRQATSCFRDLGNATSKATSLKIELAYTARALTSLQEEHQALEAKSEVSRSQDRPPRNITLSLSTASQTSVPDVVSRGVAEDGFFFLRPPRRRKRSGLLGRAGRWH